MDQVKLTAHAKVNLTLDVVGRRADGYHLLESVMQSISLADQLTLVKRPAGITIKTNVPELPLDEKNIVWQAADAFWRHTGIKGGLEIDLDKQIPLSAGLAGGSADAAAVLSGLNYLYGEQLSLEELQEIGVGVGADVPFCLQGGTIFVEGIGEKLTPLPSFPEAFFLLLQIQKEVSTAVVFRKLAERRHGSTATKELVQLLSEQTELFGLGRALANCLETVTADFIPEIAHWKQRLLEGGAEGAVMSGSGPTVVGVFSRYEQASRFQSCWGREVQIFLTRPVKAGVQLKNGGDQP